MSLLNAGPVAAGGEKRPRARDLGIKIGVLPPGPLNAVTDVGGVRVGHKTIIENDGIRTGVTAVLPHSGNLFHEKVPAAIVVGNGFGKLVGVTQVQELGHIETPIILTNTLSTFAAADAVVRYTLLQPRNGSVRSVNPVVGETNDGFLNDIRARRVGFAEVFEAIEGAQAGPVAEGSVGAGTGTSCCGWKGGIGTASRRLPEVLGGFTIGVLVQSNFGGILKVDGAPVGEALDRYYLGEAVSGRTQEGGSCMIVVATDAPLDARQLTRLARRALLGLGAVGSPMTHGSGDYVIAFAAPRPVGDGRGGRLTNVAKTVGDEALSPLFLGTKEATEEAIVNSLLKATTVRGHRGTREAIPIDKLVAVCKRYGVIRE